jgi:hypothetical protein
MGDEMCAATFGATVGKFSAGLASIAAASLTAVMTLLNLARRTDEALVAANAYLAVQQDAW